jgi:DNA-binding PucR family transcriptional regulator
VLGPTVPLYDAGRSFELACQALRVSGGHGGLVTATDLLPSVILLRDRTLTDALIRARLAPLIDADFTQARTAELARTLKSCLDNDFNAVLVAELLQVHPQTIRYRIRTLTGLFGEGLRDPAHRLGLHMAVQAWLARPPGDGNPAP